MERVAVAADRWHELIGTQAPDDPRARRAILRSMLIWTPAFALLTAAAVYLMVEALDGNNGSWFGFSLCALIGVLSGFSALSAFRDWFSEPIETTGQVARKWRKFDLLIFFRAHYVLVARRVYRVSHLVYEEMPESGGWVYTLHYPHTNALVAWRPLGVDELEALRDDEEESSESVEDAWEHRRLEREREAVRTRERVELPSFRDQPDD